MSPSEYHKRLQYSPDRPDDNHCEETYPRAGKCSYLLPVNIRLTHCGLVLFSKAACVATPHLSLWIWKISDKIPNMRLLSTFTFQLCTFVSSETRPDYAILSHCWDEDEVVFADIQDLARARAHTPAGGKSSALAPPHGPKVTTGFG